MYRLICATCVLACLCACKKQPGTQGVGNVTATVPIVAGGTPDNISLNFGFNFTSTVSATTYTVVQADCGFIKRFNHGTGIAVALPRLNYPCVIMFFNDNYGPVTVTPAEVDINGDKEVVLQFQEGMLLSLHQGNPPGFWRGLYITGRVQNGNGAPAAARCTDRSVAQVYVQRDAGVANSSLYVCANRGPGVYGWELVSGGAIPPSPIVAPVPTGYSDMSDFKATVTSDTVLTVAPGSAAMNHYSFPAQMGGTVTFTAGTGDAKVYVSKLGMLTTEAIAGSTGTITGQMIFLTTAAPSFPPGSIPICDLALNAGKYTVDGADGCKLASRVRAAAFDPGSGIDISYTSGVGKLTVDATVARSDGSNVWTGNNDFSNANVVLPAGANVATNKWSISISIASLVIAIVALVMVFKHRVRT